MFKIIKKTIKEGLTVSDKLIIIISYIKIAYIKLFTKNHTHWTSLILPVRIKNYKKPINYFGELLTYSKIQENDKFLKTILNPEYKYLLDIGGHTGRISYVFCSQDDERKSIYIEPNPNSYKLVKKFFESQEEIKKRIKLLNIGVSDKRGLMDFYLSSEFGGSSSFEKQGTYYKKITVPINSVDNLNTKYNLSEVDLVKIDVEGHEVSVLKGMINFLHDKPKTILIELNDDLAKDRFISQLKKLGIEYNYKRISKYDFLFRLWSGKNEI